MRRLLLVLLLLLVAGCTDSGDDSGSDRSPAAAAETVEVEVGTAGRVRAEVADDDEERSKGLMGRKEVPIGTGMVFRYDEPVEAEYYMYRVPVQLTAVFGRDDEVVGVALMQPCPFAKAEDCPTYGPGVPFDTVLETAPGTVAGKVKVGDPLRVLG